jgi:hypothetical protein
VEVEKELDGCREEEALAADRGLVPSFVEAESAGAVRGSLVVVLIEEVRNDLEAVRRLRWTADILTKFREEKKDVQGKEVKREAIVCRSNCLSRVKIKSLGVLMHLCR